MNAVGRVYITLFERLWIENNDSVDIDTRTVFNYDTNIINFSKWCYLVPNQLTLTANQKSIAQIQHIDITMLSYII